MAEKLSEHALKIGKVQKILLQVNIAQEAQKSGFEKQHMLNEFSEIVKLNGIEIRGLMCMTPLGENSAKIREYFKEVRQLRDTLSNDFKYDLPELSMGMSQDYVIAAQEGATMLRIGRKLFT